MGDAFRLDALLIPGKGEHVFLGVSKEEAKPAGKTIPSKKPPPAAPWDDVYLQRPGRLQGGRAAGDSQAAFQERLEEMRVTSGPGRGVAGD